MRGVPGVRQIQMLALVAVLVVSAAFCFVRYLEWSFTYSAKLGLASTQEIRVADHSAWLFFSLFVLLELFCAFVVGSRWEQVDLGSVWLRFSARYGIALLFSLLATGVVIGLAVLRHFV